MYDREAIAMASDLEVKPEELRTEGETKTDHIAQTLSDEWVKVLTNSASSCGTEKILEEDWNCSSAHSVLSFKGGRSRIRYVRDELLDLQFYGMEEQLCRWNEIMNCSGCIDAELLDMEKTAENERKPRRRNADRRKRTRKNEEASKGAKASHTAPGPLLLIKSNEQCYEELSFQISESNIENIQQSSNLPYEEQDDFEDSEDEFDSLLKPAFLVEGEPDFDSGPPQDGLEYLRRVKWEAAQFPKVRVANLDQAKLNKHQTPYMPNIPSVSVCSKDLLPSKDWEREFLADFSDLRMDLSSVELLNDHQLKSLPSYKNKVLWEKFCFGSICSLSSDEESSPLAKEKEEHENDILEDLNSEFTEANEFLKTNDKINCVVKEPSEDPLGEIRSATSPLLPVMLSLDEIARATVFKYHVTWLEKLSSLSKDRAVWLFALCAVLDKPLDAETSAAARALLRKCSSLRAGKTGDDEELAMLNILIAIAGKYFGQAEDLTT